jgi:protein-disulfide isomerase
MNIKDFSKHKPMFSKFVLFAMFPVLVLFCGGTMAQTNADVRKDVDELKRGQKAIQSELVEIKALLKKLSAQPAAAPTAAPVPQSAIKGMEFDIGDNPVKGNAKADLVLVEFTDYQCPFCGRFVRETFPQIAKQYIDKGVLRYAVVDQPLSSHPNAQKAAEASHCAADQGKFWEIHESMMHNQNSLTNLSFFAKSLTLDLSQLDKCVSGGKYATKVRGNIALAQKLGISGVPGFIIGRVEPAKSGAPMKIKGISMIRGAVPLADFQKEIDAALMAR